MCVYTFLINVYMYWYVSFCVGVWMDVCVIMYKLYIIHVCVCACVCVCGGGCRCVYLDM